MSAFNPDFWEVHISEESWQRFSEEDHLYHEPAEDTEPRCRQRDEVERLWPGVRDLVEAVLTGRQREVVELYFLQGLNQRDVAERLKISQQSVSEHLYGKVRGGHAVGGALRKLRKECERRGIAWQR
jgi:DNA-directed RNA polymerase specialized sigma24 family protein